MSRVAAAGDVRAGFALIDRHLREAGRSRAALCAIELRSPAPFSFEGFDAFNGGYCRLLAEWKLLVDGENPIARTNVAPLVGAPAEPSLYAFAYTVPGATSRPTFVVAGAGGRADVTAIDIYTASPLETFLADTVLRPAGAAAIHGVRWFPSRPPIIGLEYEMDLRGVARELVVPIES